MDGRISTFRDNGSSSSSSSSSGYYSKDDDSLVGSLGSLEEAIHLMEGHSQPSAPPGSVRTVGTIEDSLLAAAPVGETSAHSEDAVTPQEEHHYHNQQQEQVQQGHFNENSQDHPAREAEPQSDPRWPCIVFGILIGSLLLIVLPLCLYAGWIIFRHHSFRSRLPLASGLECRRDSHCSSGVCAYGTSSRMEVARAESSDEDEEQICCPDGSLWTTGYSTDGVFRRVCTGMPVGTRCGTMDEMCASGLCIGGSCVDRALRSQERCDRNRECEHNACAHSEAYVGAPTACCATSTTHLSTVPLGLEETTSDAHLTVQVCGELDAGAFCHDVDALCASGLCINQRCAAIALPDWEECKSGNSNHCQSGACGWSTLSNATMCCPNGATTVLAGSLDSTEGALDLADRTLCSSMPLRAPCFDSDEVCASGHCINGFCAATLLRTEQDCIDPADCSSGFCALADASATASTVCCPESDLNGVCTDRGLGADCGENLDICSGLLVCLQGQCSWPLIDNEFCSSSRTCLSQACAQGAGVFEAPTVCCASGQMTPGSVENPEGEFVPVSLCTEQPSGTECGNNDAMCANGLFCVNGRCGQRLGPLELCVASNDCADGACALANADANSSNVCCALGQTARGSIVDGAGGSTVATVCANQPIGAHCGTFTGLCAPALRCIDETCAVPLSAGAPCTESLECASGTCAAHSANQTVAFTVCCESSITTFEDLFDPSGNSVIGVSEVCGSPPSASSSSDRMTSTFPIPVAVRRMTVLHSGIQDTNVTQAINVVDREKYDAVGEATCTIMVDFIQQAVLEPIDSHDCFITMIEPGPLLSYFLVVFFQQNASLTEDEMYSVLQSSFASNQDDVVQDLVLQLPPSNPFAQTTGVLLSSPTS